MLALARWLCARAYRFQELPKELQRQVALQFSWGEGSLLFFFSGEIWTLQVICGTGMLVSLRNSCVKRIKDEASHDCAAYGEVCEKGWMFFCFIVFLTNLLCRFKRLLSRAMKKLKVYEERESQLNLQGEIKNRYSEMVSEVGILRTKVSSGLWGCFLF